MDFFKEGEGERPRPPLFVSDRVEITIETFLEAKRDMNINRNSFFAHPKGNYRGLEGEIEISPSCHSRLPVRKAVANSIFQGLKRRDCFVASLLAMTKYPPQNHIHKMENPISGIIPIFAKKNGFR
jgi:hypothetical protein